MCAVHVLGEDLNAAASSTHADIGVDVSVGSVVADEVAGVHGPVLIADDGVERHYGCAHHAVGHNGLQAYVVACETLYVALSHAHGRYVACGEATEGYVGEFVECAGTVVGVGIEKYRACELCGAEAEGVDGNRGRVHSEYTAVQGEGTVVVEAQADAVYAHFRRCEHVVYKVVAGSACRECHARNGALQARCINASGRRHGGHGRSDAVGACENGVERAFHGESGVEVTVGKGGLRGRVGAESEADVADVVFGSGCAHLHAVECGVGFYVCRACFVGSVGAQCG